MSEAKKEESKTGKEPAVRKIAVKERPEAVVYVGPSIKNIVSANTVYNNGLPERLLKEMEKQPAIKSFIIPVAGLADIQKELRTKGSAADIIYQKIKTT